MGGQAFYLLNASDGNQKSSVMAFYINEDSVAQLKVPDAFITIESDGHTTWEGKLHSGQLSTVYLVPWLCEILTRNFPIYRHIPQYRCFPNLHRYQRPESWVRKPCGVRPQQRSGMEYLQERRQACVRAEWHPVQCYLIVYLTAGGS